MMPVQIQMALISLQNVCLDSKEKHRDSFFDHALGQKWLAANNTIKL